MFGPLSPGLVVASAGASWEIQKALQQAPRYNRWIHDLIAPHVGRRVLDAGCGMGNITRLFLDRELIVGVEHSAEFCAYLEETLSPHENFVLVCGDLTDTATWSRLPADLDTVVCVNVLEHISDDVGLLARFRDALAPSGKVVLFVPAHPWLYGAHDEADGHFRRYTMRGLQRTMGRAGLKLVTSRWVNLPGIPGWWLNKCLRRRFGEGQCSCFDRLIPPIVAIERVLPPPIGLSILAVGQRDEQPVAVESPLRTPDP